MSDEQKKNSESSETEKNQEQFPPTLLGWAARIFSLATILGLLGIIGWQISKPDRPTYFEVTVETEEIRAQDGQYLIPVTVKNKGTQTARAVSVELTPKGSEAVEVTLPLVGHKESLSFEISSPVPSETVDLRIISYEAI